MANKTTFNMPSIDEIVKDKAMQQARELDALINDMVDSLSKVSDGKNLSKYWKTQDELIQDVIKSQKEFNREVNNVNASNLLKVVNALKAIHGNDISDIIPDFSGLEKSMQAAKNMIGSLDSAFDVKSFERTFASFEGLKAYGLDLESFFKHFELDIDTQRLRESLQIAEDATNELRRELHSTQAELTSKKIELDSFIDGSGLTEQIEKLKKLEDEIERIRKNASREFKTFLRANDFVGQDLDEDGQFYKYFDDIKNGTLSARQAIANFKSEYGHLLQENYNQSGGLFNIQQIQAFENKLETVLSRVEEISRQMNNIVENGVMTKAMQNLSVDDTISQSQRDLFANVLKDEEALSSIAGVLKKIIDESVTLQGVNNKTFDEEQFNRLLILFEKIESSLSSMKAVFIDVGDGEEFSPLLKMIDNVQSSIKELSTSVNGIGLNMNIDVGSDKELETQFQDKISKALIAYQRLFDHIKMSGVGGSVINDAFFNFDLNQFDTTIGKVKGLQQFIAKAREDAKALYGGQDVLKQDTDVKFWNQASAALAQMSIVEKQIRDSTDTSSLESLFGGKTDLTEVTAQLGLIVTKLEEISANALEFKNIFKEGFNVTTSIEEIEKLTSRVKELEDELSKVKVSSTSPVETNISSPIKDTFQGDLKASESATSLGKEADEMKEIAEVTPKATKAKNEFADANERVDKGAKKSSESVSKEASEFNKIIGKLDGYNTKLASFTVKPADGNRYPIYQKNIDDLTEKINKLQVLSEKDINLINTNDVEDAKALQKQIDELIFKMSKMSASEKGFDPLGADKALEKIHNELQKNSGMSKEAKRQIQSYYDEIRSGNPSKPIKDLLDDMYKLIQLEREAGRAHKSFTDIFKEKVVYGAAANMAGMIGIYDIINAGREGINVIRELDTALTEMRKVSDETVSSLEKFQDVSFDLADDVGTTSKQIQNSTADFMRIGEVLNEASESAKTANILKNVSEFESINDATDSLISMSQAYKELEKIEIVDTLNRLGNEYAISTDGLAIALKDSASALKTAQNDFYESSALTTAANTVVQDPSKVGAGLRTISLRLTGTEAARKELEELGEDVSDFQVTTTSKLNQQIMDLTRTQDGLSVSLLDMNGNYRSTYEILLDIAKVWNKIAEEDLVTGENRQNALLEMMAGKNRSNILASILESPDVLESAYNSAINASGSAQEELDKFLESIDGRMAKLENQAQEFWYKFIDSDTIKNGITLLTELLGLATDFVDTFGALGTAGIIGSGILGGKNLGKFA